jgi:tetratricopeptide (TPR) repeat protein
MNRLLVSLTLVCVTLSFAAAAVEIDDVGSITFPTSGSPEAQEHFLRGAGILYSFGWKQAIEQFQAAQQLEPDFAMAYWGESLCYNHPLMAEQDRDNPVKVLLRLGATREERVAKAPTAKEKGYVGAVDALFMGEGSPTERRIAYMEAMRRLHQSFPEDQEVATFYSLALLSAAGPMGDESLRTRVLAGAIALDVFSANPEHPGAAHYIIHAFDDPVHAPIALPAAWKFAAIAPAVSHARHMPTHIFIQHGMWEEVSASNQSAYDVAVELWEPGDSAGDMTHALDWGQYGDLQLGDYEKARVWIERMEEIVAKTGTQARPLAALPRVKARYVIETEQWKTQPVTDESTAVELLATGVSAVELGDLELAQQAELRLKALADEAPDDDTSYFAFTSKPVQIMHKEIAALIRLELGQQAEAIALLEDGVAIAESMRAPNGAANPIKPVHELLGEVLLTVGDGAGAVESFERSLSRTPNRPLSLLGLARANVEVGDLVAARVQYRKLADVWEGRDKPELAEATQYIDVGAARDF